MKHVKNNQTSVCYTLEKEIGAQKTRKFGQVYLGHITETLEKVVIKRQPRSEYGRIEVMQMEAEQYFTFNQKGLPEIIDYFKDESHMYLIKKHQNGIPLDIFWNNLKRNEQLPFIIRLVTQLIDLLDQLHEKNIFHCDLKPSNILVQKSENGFEIEIIDFGLAIQQPIIEKRKLIFPLGYAAPELILNRLNLVNETTDYFSLGIIIWRLFCGKLPLSHPNPSIYTNLQLVHPLQNGSGLPKGMLPNLNRLSKKYAFKTAPNKIRVELVDSYIEEVQAIRKEAYQDIIENLLNCKPKRWYQF